MNYKYECMIPFLLFLVIVFQNPIWPLWNFGVSISYIFLLLVAVMLFKRGKMFVNSWVLYICSFFFLLLSFILIPSFKTFHLSNIFILLSFFLLRFLTISERERILYFVTKYLYVIIVISFPLWFIHAFIVELPVFGELDLSELKGTFYPINNYFFFVTNSNIETYRFYSMFDEPGVLGTISAFILYGNRYDFFKKENIVILIGGIFTFSLAFYILTITGYILFNIKSVKQIMFSLIIIALLSTIVFYYLKDNEAFQNSIIERLSMDDTEVLDRRTGYNTALFFDNLFRTDDVWFGIGSEQMQILGVNQGASYKMFIIEYGIVSLVVLIFSYFSLINKYNWKSILFIILFILSFLQRPYAFTSWQFIIFYCVIYISEVNYENNKFIK